MTGDAGPNPGPDPQRRGYTPTRQGLTQDWLLLGAFVAALLGPLAGLAAVILVVPYPAPGREFTAWFIPALILLAPPLFSLYLAARFRNEGASRDKRVGAWACAAIGLAIVVSCAVLVARGRT